MLQLSLKRPSAKIFSLGYVGWYHLAEGGRAYVETSNIASDRMRANAVQGDNVAHARTNLAWNIVVPLYPAVGGSAIPLTGPTLSRNSGLSRDFI
jgi:hypothetical protein